MTSAEEDAAEILIHNPGQAYADDNAAWAAFAARNRTWSDGVEWWKHPATCYHKGLEDGIAMGREQAQREMMDAFYASLGGDGKTKLQDAISRHIRSVEATARRKEWDAAAKRDMRRAA